MNFNIESKTWDSDYRVSRAERIAEEIKSYLNNREDISVVEFGCGTGLISFNMKDYFRKCLLVDLSEGMIEELNKKMNENQINNMQTWCGDIVDFHVKEKYDVIYTSMAMHHVVNLDDTITKLYDMLKPNGKLIIVDLLKDDGTFHSLEENFEGHNGFEIEEMKSILRSVGFDEVVGRVFYVSSKVIKNKEHEYSLFSICATK